MGRHLIDRGEAAVVHLLHTADVVKLGGLDRHGIVEVGNAGIVEGDVAVLTDAHDHDIGRVLFKKGGVAAALGLGIVGRIDVIDRAEGDKREDMLGKEVAKALGSVLGKADVLVHMEGVDARPVDRLVGDERGQHLILRGGGGKDHIDVLALLEQGADPCGDLGGGEGAHGGAALLDLNGQLIYGKGLHSILLFCILISLYRKRAQK